MKSVWNNTGRIRACLLCILIFSLCMPLFTACTGPAGKTPVRVLIIPKFEIGEMSGDFPGKRSSFMKSTAPAAGRPKYRTCRRPRIFT